MVSHTYCVFQTRKFPHIVSLNVGGCHYMTRLSTLCRYPDSMLAAMFSGRHQLDQDGNGSYFLDSNGSCFVHILDFLRHGILPPNNVALKVYREACYYGIQPLITKLQTSPEVAKMLVCKAHRGQFPDYEGMKLKIINIAMERATINRTGEVLIYAFRQEFKAKSPYFDAHHECIADTAHLRIGPWDTPPEEEIFIKTLEQDLLDDGFVIKQHVHRKQCTYFNGENCQKTIYRIIFIF